ncbi:helix-turn-helix domain-containing protein [Micromonospora echinofusca]|uniref:Helix-turn-helix domain-containing protein n=1 Tax=Micromonospora echinofusca TaxID=47858 RepID=A0ABS3VWY8_MICEH|nr:MarR family winged helix-turn-helix transcriptional regulator [Micromonospora echinofusca]MBO4209018.1 helix-turn-helix domain-containing protein [Micromonospora echinofusca]
MAHLSLTPATQAVLDALTDLGQGTVPELADRSGKARSTTDKAIKTLADAGVIVPVETDPTDDTPTRWALAAPVRDTTATPDDASGADSGADHTAGQEETDLADPDVDDATDEPDTAQTGQPGGVIDPTGTNDATGRNDETGDAHDATDRHDDSNATADGGEGSDNSEGDEQPPVTAVQPTRPGDRKVMAIKGVLADHGDDGASIDVIVAESGIGHPTASRLLTAMEQADAARRLPGVPLRWIPGPTRASEVDPSPQPPRCPLCHHVIRGLANGPNATATVLPLIRPDGTLHVVGPDGATHVVTLPTRTAGAARGVGRRGDATVNADGSPPFGRGELEKLTLDVLAAHPGEAMTPQDIATVIGEQLGRTVSSGAVRNNCTKAAAAGRIVLASDAPLTFTYPTPPGSDTAETIPGGTAIDDEHDTRQS